MPYRQFQFTHPGGVRPTASHSSPTSSSFNSRTREGCDVRMAAMIMFFDKFQFTHPGGVRQRSVDLLDRGPAVSIHAPGRGATIYKMSREGRSDVSIHAPGRGATAWRPDNSRPHPRFQFTHPGGVRLSTSCSMLLVTSGFNSRTREGCDPRRRRQGGRGCRVSIHAPGRGATLLP